MRKFLIIIMILLVSLSLFAGGAKEEAVKETETQSTEFTDSLGRSHTFDGEIERIAPSGSLSQMVLYSLVPEKLVGLSSDLSDNELLYLDEKMADLPLFGTFYGKKANLNKEALVYASPDVVIDAGDIKDGIAEDLDNLEKEIGIPVVFIECFLTNTADAYRKLGSLVGNEERAEILASYSQKAIDKADEARQMIENPVSVYYSSSPDGLNGIPTGNFHAEVIELVGGENVIPANFSSGSNIVSLEQILIWNPDVILLVDENAYRTVTTDSSWASLDAVKNNRVYLIPQSPYSFIDNPPAINRIIGIYWLGSVLYPDLYSEIDLEEEVRTFYDLFYGYSLSDDEVDMLLDSQP